jgi:hypothetical protein
LDLRVVRVEDQDPVVDARVPIPCKEPGGDVAAALTDPDDCPVLACNSPFFCGVE